MWIEWADRLINLDHAREIQIEEIPYDQWIVKISIDIDRFYSCPIKLFECEKNAKEEYEKLKKMLGMSFGKKGETNCEHIPFFSGPQC